MNLNSERLSREFKDHTGLCTTGGMENKCRATICLSNLQDSFSLFLCWGSDNEDDSEDEGEVPQKKTKKKASKESNPSDAKDKKTKTQGEPVDPQPKAEKSYL